MVRQKIINKEASTHDEKFDDRKTKLVHCISFLMGFAQAILLYIMSSYFKQASGTENVGLFYFIAYTVSLIIFLNLHKVVKRIGKSNAFLFSLLFKIITITFLLNTAPSILSVVISMAFIILGNLEWLSLDIILESFSSDIMSGRIRGKHLTILNAGLLLGPFISTRLLDHFGFSGIFMTLFLLNSVIFIVAMIGLRNVNHRFDGGLTMRDLVTKVFKRKNIMRAYYVSFALEFFYALMIIYSPLYMRDLGMSWNKIGSIFTFMLVPFVILQYPMGMLADKRFGEKEFMIVSIFIMGFSTIAVFFTTSTSIFVWAIVLFLTRIGAALIEVLRDSYFFKRIDGRDVDIIDFYRTAQSTAFILATAISTIMLIFFPVRSVFLAVAVVIFLALIPAFRLEDNKCERELGIKPGPALSLNK